MSEWGARHSSSSTWAALPGQFYIADFWGGGKQKKSLKTTIIDQVEHVLQTFETQQAYEDDSFEQWEWNVQWGEKTSWNKYYLSTLWEWLMSPFF